MHIPLNSGIVVRDVEIVSNCTHVKIGYRGFKARVCPAKKTKTSETAVGKQVANIPSYHPEPQ
jgi:hypothetical protein